MSEVHQVPIYDFIAFYLPVESKRQVLDWLVPVGTMAVVVVFVVL